MSINDLLLKLAYRLEKKQEPIYSYDVEKQKKYINHFREPVDDIERSIFQYKCQMKLYGGFISFCLNVLSLPIAALYYLKYSKQKNVVCVKKAAVFFRDGKPDNIMPTELRERLGDIESNPIEGNILEEEDREYLKKIIRRYPFSWHFILKAIIKISKYKYSVQKYDPRTIVVCNEYSFTSSLLTDYCHHYGIKHINVMHGEKFYFIRDSFYHYDEFYVWDKYYKELAKELRAEETQFIIAEPPSLRLEGNFSKKVDYCYYLARESNEQLKKINDALLALVAKGFAVKIRPHPRYSNLNTIRDVFREIEIEDLSVELNQSILESKRVIAVFSTVLQQAYRNQITVVIDDVSDPKRYSKLTEIRFFMLYKEHEKLSDLVRRGEHEH